MYANEIAKSKRVANPGCYATSVILGLAPIKDKISNTTITSISGISGAGLARMDENFLVYKENQDHPQIMEMQKALGADIQFTPIRADSVDRGIVSIITANISYTPIEKLYFEAYAQKPFINLKNKNGSIETKNLIGSNYCDIKIISGKGNVKIISTLDNIVKGGSGQAVQNFNLMYGLDEKTGLL